MHCVSEKRRMNNAVSAHVWNVQSTSIQCLLPGPAFRVMCGPSLTFARVIEVDIKRWETDFQRWRSGEAPGNGSIEAAKAFLTNTILS